MKNLISWSENIIGIATMTTMATITPTMEMVVEMAAEKETKVEVAVIKMRRPLPIPVAKKDTTMSGRIAH